MQHANLRGNQYGGKKRMTLTLERERSAHQPWQRTGLWHVATVGARKYGQQQDPNGMAMLFYPDGKPRPPLRRKLMDLEIAGQE